MAKKSTPVRMIPPKSKKKESKVEEAVVLPGQLEVSEELEIKYAPQPVKVAQLLETDEDKTTEQLWHIKKTVNSHDIVFGYDEYFKDTSYKIYKDHIKSITAYQYIADMAVSPTTVVGEKFFIYHGGRRIVDIVTKEVYSDLLLDSSRNYSVSFYAVDLGDPIERRSYKIQDHNFNLPSVESVIEDRDNRLKAIEKEKKKRNEDSILSDALRTPIKERGDYSGSDTNTCEEDTVSDSECDIDLSSTIEQQDQQEESQQVIE